MNDNVIIIFSSLLCCFPENPGAVRQYLVSVVGVRIQRVRISIKTEKRFFSNLILVRKSFWNFSMHLILVRSQFFSNFVL